MVNAQKTNAIQSAPNARLPRV